MIDAAMGEHLHQETGLSAGTVADNDELASNFRHLQQSVCGIEVR